MKSIRHRDIAAGLLFIIVAALIIWVAIPYGVQEPKKVKFAALSPSYYPRLVGYCLLGFGVILAISRWLSDKADESDDDEGSQKRGMLILPGILITLLAYYACLETLGFVLSSTGALIILLLLAGERKPIPLILIPLLLPLGLHLFFTHLANIPIPAGPLQSLIGGA